MKLKFKKQAYQTRAVEVTKNMAEGIEFHLTAIKDVLFVRLS